jgi:hypothetical protein
MEPLASLGSRHVARLLVRALYALGKLGLCKLGWMAPYVRAKSAWVAPAFSRTSLRSSTCRQRAHALGFKGGLAGAAGKGYQIDGLYRHEA